MNNEDYEDTDAYGIPFKYWDQLRAEANPHIPPWLLEKKDDVQKLHRQVMIALHTGELGWIKDPKQRKGPLASKQAQQERNWTSIGCGAVLFVVWTLGALFAASSNPEEVTGLWWFIRMGWLFFAWGFPIQFLREQSQK